MRYWHRCQPWQLQTCVTIRVTCLALFQGFATDSGKREAKSSESIAGAGQYKPWSTPVFWNQCNQCQSFQSMQLWTLTMACPLRIAPPNFRKEIEKVKVAAGMLRGTFSFREDSARNRLKDENMLLGPSVHSDCLVQSTALTTDNLGLVLANQSLSCNKY